VFAQYFPNPETFKKRKGKEQAIENPYKAITGWFDAGNALNIFLETKDADKILMLYKVNGLHALVKKYFNIPGEKENALLMELVLHGLAAYSLISKKIIDGKIEFKDLMGSMFNFSNTDELKYDDEEE
ncbi:MAG: magnesium chelatase, partial [Ferruginibacter sp.]